LTSRQIYGLESHLFITVTDTDWPLPVLLQPPIGAVLPPVSGDFISFRNDKAASPAVAGKAAFVISHIPHTIAASSHKSVLTLQLQPTDVNIVEGT
jgi:hypothetical protein